MTDVRASDLCQGSTRWIDFNGIDSIDSKKYPDCDFNEKKLISNATDADASTSDPSMVWSTDDYMII